MQPNWHAMSALCIRKLVRATAPGGYDLLIKLYRMYAHRTIYNVYREDSTGRRRALLSYLPHSFRYGENDNKINTKGNLWVCREIANSLRALNYIVDVCYCLRQSLTLRHSYDLIFETGFNLDRVRRLLPPSCIKVVYNTGNHWLFQNGAEFERLGAIKARRGAVLQPRRMVQPSMMHLFADAVILPGKVLKRAHSP